MAGLVGRALGIRLDGGITNSTNVQCTRLQISHIVSHQTIMNLIEVDEESASAVVGALVPLDAAAMAILDAWGLKKDIVSFKDHFDW